MTTDASVTQEVLDPCVAAVAGGRGARPTGESFPNLCDKGMSRRQSWLICVEKGGKKTEKIRDIMNNSIYSWSYFADGIQIC